MPTTAEAVSNELAHDICHLAVDFANFSLDRMPETYRYLYRTWIARLADSALSEDVTTPIAQAADVLRLQSNTDIPLLLLAAEVAAVRNHIALAKANDSDDFGLLSDTAGVVKIVMGSIKSILSLTGAGKALIESIEELAEIFKIAADRGDY